jgi:hypothetical protein
VSPLHTVSNVPKALVDKGRNPPLRDGPLMLMVLALACRIGGETRGTAPRRATKIYTSGAACASRLGVISTDALVGNPAIGGDGRE